MNRCKKCQKEISKYEIYCDECKNLQESEKKLDNMPKHINKESINRKVSKKHKKIIIIISAFIIVLAMVLIILLVLMNNDNDKNSNVKIDKDEVKITNDEFRAIIESYGKAAEVASKNYMTLNKGNVPEFKDIKDNIVFSSYNVECKISKVNYDGSIYITNCKVDGKSYIDKYSYGKEKEKLKKSGNKIYLYKNKAESTYLNSITGEEVTYEGYHVSNYDEDSQYSTKLSTYECDNKCVGYDYSETLGLALIYDGDYYLYNFNNGIKEKINVKDNIASMIFVESNYKALGIQMAKKDSYNYAFYSFKDNKIVTDYKYNYIYTLDNLSNKGYVVANSNNNTYIIDYATGKEIKKIDNYSNIEEEYVINKYYYKANSIYGNNKVVLNDSFDKIIDGNYDSAFNSDGTITVKFLKDSSYNLYDRNGNFISKSKDYKKIVKVLNDYVVVLDENNLIVLDNNENKVANLGELDGNYEIHSLASGWYSKDGKNGIYVVVENKDIPYGQQGSSIEYYYIPSTKEVGAIKDIGVGGYAKPVLYLYPDKKTDIKVSFEKPELLTTTYPKFNKKWKVTAYKNGDLYDVRGKYYYGLYWEEKGSSKVDFHEGFYVTKDNAIEFLEKKLEIIGLNKRESNEFIMYWLPILEKNEKSLVYFELTNERQKYNKIKITPEPDSLLRVAIHVKKVNKKTDIKEQKLDTFKRVGYTAIEWGGVVH